MKPDQWGEMTPQDRYDVAIQLLDSFRGKLIMGQALAHAVMTLRKVEPPHVELSNIQDMEMLGESLFQPWYELYLKEGSKP